MYRGSRRVSTRVTRVTGGRGTVVPPAPTTRPPSRTLPRTPRWRDRAAPAPAWELGARRVAASPHARAVSRRVASMSRFATRDGGRAWGRSHRFALLSPARRSATAPRAYRALPLCAFPWRTSRHSGRRERVRDGSGGSRASRARMAPHARAGASRASPAPQLARAVSVVSPGGYLTGDVTWVVRGAPRAVPGPLQTPSRLSRLQLRCWQAPGSRRACPPMARDRGTQAKACSERYAARSLGIA